MVKYKQSQNTVHACQLCIYACVYWKLNTSRLFALQKLVNIRILARQLRFQICRCLTVDYSSVFGCTCNNDYILKTSSCLTAQLGTGHYFMTSGTGMTTIWECRCRIIRSKVMVKLVFRIVGKAILMNVTISTREFADQDCFIASSSCTLHTKTILINLRNKREMFLHRIIPKKNGSRESLTNGHRLGGLPAVLCKLSIIERQHS